MAFQKITENVENISTLSDTPALTPSELKKIFDKGNKIIKDNFNILIDELNSNMYPIGTGFIAYNDTDYTNHLGFKWERTLLGKTPVGKNDEEEFNLIGKTGGEKTHIMTIEESAKHKHKMKEIKYSGVIDKFLGRDGQAGYTAGEYYTEETGGNQPHNNMQPYQVVNFWKRIS